MEAGVSDQQLRPFERTMDFILKKLPEQDRQIGRRLPTTRELSKQIQVSSATVRNVYRHLADRGILKMGVGRGTFWANPPDVKKRELAVGMNMKQFPDDRNFRSWAYRIYGGMLRAIFERQIPIRLRLADVPKDEGAGSHLERWDRAIADLDGFILMPLPGVEQFEDHLCRRKIPHVSLNPHHVNATANFVSPDYYAASYALGRTLARTGRKKIMTFMSPGDELSISEQLRVAGFFAGLHSVGCPPKVRKLVIAAGDEAMARTAFEDFLARTEWWPDAVYASGDAMAAAVWKVADTAGVSVPEDLSLVGGNGLMASQPGERPLTAMVQPLEKVGEGLIAVLEKMLFGEAVSVPGIYLPMQFSCGSSTRENENTWLSTEGRTLKKIDEKPNFHCNYRVGPGGLAPAFRAPAEKCPI